MFLAKHSYSLHSELGAISVCLRGRDIEGKIKKKTHIFWFNSQISTKARLRQNCGWDLVIQLRNSIRVSIAGILLLQSSAAFQNLHWYEFGSGS